MKVKDMIRALMDKDPNDDVRIELNVVLTNDDGHKQRMSGEADVDDVKPGNTPVLLAADIHIEIESTLIVW